MSNGTDGESNGYAWDAHMHGQVAGAITGGVLVANFGKKALPALLTIGALFWAFMYITRDKPAGEEP